MSEDEILEAVAAYDSFVQAALDAAKQWGCYISEPDTAKAYITTDGEVAIRSWRATSNGWDGYEIEEEIETVPLAFFFAGDEQRASMLAVNKAKQEADNRAGYEARARQEEAKLRQAYEALKRKFG